MRKLLCVLMALSLFALSACEKNEDALQSEAKLTDYNAMHSEEPKETTEEKLELLNLCNDEYTIKNGVLFKYKGDSENVVIPNGVSEIGYQAFASCHSLTSVEIPNTVTRIGDYAFDSCESLEKIQIPDTVTQIGNQAFHGTPWLENNTDEFVFAGNHILIKYNGSDTKLKIPDHVTIIGGSAFESCKSLTSVEIPNTVTQIGDYAFDSCESLEKIQMPDTVTQIGDQAFHGTPWLENNTNEFVLAGNDILIKCNAKDTSVKIPDGVTKIGASAFESCKSLTSVEIPDSVTEIGNCAFCGCTALTDVEIPDSVSEIGPNAFTNTPWLEHTTDNFVVVGNHVFIKYNGNDTNVKIPNHVTKIAGGAFEQCDSLISVEIPDTVTEIGNGAFAFCTSLTNVKIPTKNIKIGACAFWHTPWGDANGYNYGYH